MSTRKLLVDHLAPAVSRVLLGAAFGAPAAAIGGSIVDFLKSKLNDRHAADEAARRFERLADASITSLVPLFEGERARGLDPQAVALALAETLDQHVDAKALIEQDLDADKLHRSVLRARPLKELEQQAYGPANIGLYRRALPVLLNEIVTIAPELKGFTVANSAEVLRRLNLLLGVEQARFKQEVKERHAFERIYARCVLERWNKLELFGIDVSEDVQRRQELSIAYIALNLQNDVSGVRSQDRPGHLVTFNALLEQTSRRGPPLLVLGEAGGGKTTLLRWAAVSRWPISSGMQGRQSRIAC